VLDSLGTTRLVLSGNSCHLAKWDARLGIHFKPFVAGLSSLTNDGGSISLMDVIVERLYPMAYMCGDKGSKGSPWGEEEERAKQDIWRVGAWPTWLMYRIGIQARRLGYKMT
jgi:breast cancer 2 susceptibility protein